jgi:hypothetical protein
LTPNKSDVISYDNVEEDEEDGDVSKENMELEVPLVSVNIPVRVARFF